MNKNNTNSMRGRFVLVILAIILIASIWFLFLRNSGMDTGDATDILVGTWQRSDGPYNIEIIEVLDDGKMTAAYFNPGPIHVGRSGWKVKDEMLWIFVELKDENYPGSLYELSYDKDRDMLKGTYYQAVAGQTFSVEFNKK
jgi:hypothetical protein